jgi:hypothetical protein
MAKRKKGKYVSAETISQIKKLLDGHRLSHGYKIVKRKRKRKGLFAF